MILLWTTVFVVAVQQVTSLSPDDKKCNGCESSGRGLNEKINVNLSLVGTIERIVESSCNNKTKLGTTEPARDGVTTNVTETTQGLQNATHATPSRALECPKNLFNLVDGGCFKVLIGPTSGWDASRKCKQYASDNNLPEKNVNTGAIRNKEQNDAVLRFALENENITKHGENPKQHFGNKHMLIGIWHTDPAGTVDPVWRYVGTNETLVYENWNKGEPNRRGTPKERCVQLYLVADKASVRKVVGKWTDISCEYYNIAVLCEYKESASSADNHGKTAA